MTSPSTTSWAGLTSPEGSPPAGAGTGGDPPQGPNPFLFFKRKETGLDAKEKNRFHVQLPSLIDRRAVCRVDQLPATASGLCPASLRRVSTRKGGWCRHKRRRAACRGMLAVLHGTGRAEPVGGSGDNSYLLGDKRRGYQNLESAFFWVKPVFFPERKWVCACRASRQRPSPAAAGEISPAAEPRNRPL